MMLKARYWDSVVWLGVLNAEPDKLVVCRDQLERARQGEFKIVCSAVTLTEVISLRGPDRVKLPPSVNSKIVAFFNHPFIDIRPVDRMIGEKARGLVWAYQGTRHGLKPYDAIHAATAAFHNIPILHTYDDDLLQLDGLIQCSNGTPLQIMKPDVGPLVPFLYSDSN